MGSGFFTYAPTSRGGGSGGGRTAQFVGLGGNAVSTNIVIGVTTGPVITVCVFITAGRSTKLFAWEGGVIWEDMCYERRRAEACVN
jgi:hypothetical protein